MKQAFAFGRKNYIQLHLCTSLCKLQQSIISIFFMNKSKRKITSLLLFIFCFMLMTFSVSAQSFTVENYYKVKWGYAEEFIGLWKKNHYPLLKKAQEKGDIISVAAEKPRYHSGEDTRWDFKVTIVFKSAASAFDENLTTPYKAQLYPDASKLEKDEQHRFELLLAHWDVMTENVNLE